MIFPEYRPRRLRRTENMRAMVRETALVPGHLIYPLFVVTGRNVRQPIEAMPGCWQMSVDMAVEEAKEVSDLGIPAVILFGIPEKKDSRGSQAWARKGIVQKAVSAVKKAVPELLVITDVCLCEYTSHGHCGLLSGSREKGVSIDNDSTIELLAKTALSHARAGADIVAPSDMMDGRVGAIRESLDNEGFDQVPILSYAVKYASAFYGPFREAAECAPQFGDRRSYQMDPANSREALREAMLDLQEGVDILMVKPAMPYLDIITRLRQEFSLPVAAYQVSGEYSMIKAAAEKGWLDEEAVMKESLLSLRRAGADMIVTYFAKDFAKLYAQT
ncbi:MAG TPA: porphobilinogen synthase [Thermodesulfobacteriaceae bacterium]|nr:porphobilinogen synthase [Thermodesulfobacteriaceae bacterium]